RAGGGDLRRARRRPQEHRLLPPAGAGLRVLLAVPDPGRAPGRRPRGAGRAGAPMSPAPAWAAAFPGKVMSAAEAVRLIPAGRRILIGSGAAEPVSLVSALVRDAPQCADNEIVHLLTLGPAPYVEPGQQDRFRHCAFFIGANVREAVQEGRADFMPVFLSEIPELIRSRRVRIDVALIQVSPPDAHGYCSLG